MRAMVDVVLTEMESSMLWISGCWCGGETGMECKREAVVMLAMAMQHSRLGPMPCYRTELRGIDGNEAKRQQQRSTRVSRCTDGRTEEGHSRVESSGDQRDWPPD